MYMPSFDNYSKIVTMNIIRMTGGLGNQMFQYALYLNFINKGIPCKFEDWTEYEGKSNARPILLKKAFDISYPLATKEEYIEMTDSYMDIAHRILRKIRGRKTRQYSEQTFDFDANVLLQDNAYLTGYFQSEKYFNKIEGIVRESFKFTDNTVLKCKEILFNNASFKPYENRAMVSLHIRRGDYLNIENEFGNICTDEYYKKAIEYISNKVANPVFLIFSNDLEWTGHWCSQNMSSVKYVLIEGTTEETGYLDMCLMSQCAHNIMANSSFSWWGAYLNSNPDKIVIAPPIWNNVTKQKDIFSSWMTIL